MPVIVENEDEWLKQVGVVLDMCSNTPKAHSSSSSLKCIASASPTKAKAMTNTERNSIQLNMLRKWRGIHKWDTSQDPRSYWVNLWEPQYQPLRKAVLST